MELYQKHGVFSQDFLLFFGCVANNTKLLVNPVSPFMLYK